MAIPWLTVLQIVPWTQVIDNAPKLADGAKKLWSAVSSWSPEVLLPADRQKQQAGTEAEAIAMLQARLAATEAAITDLHEQMLASSELIKTLADQNTQLIARVERMRVRSTWLAAALAGLTAITLVTLGLLLLR